MTAAVQVSSSQRHGFFSNALSCGALLAALYWLLDAALMGDGISESLLPADPDVLLRRSIESVLIFILAAALNRQWIERTRNERALARRIAEQESLLREAPVAILFTRHRIMIRGNDYFEMTFGWRAGDYEGKRTEILYPDQASYKTASVTTREFLADSRRDWIEHDLKRKNGELFPARVRGTWINPKNPDAGEIWLIEDVSPEMAARREREIFTADLEMGLERLNRSQRAGQVGNWDYQIDTGKLWFSEEMNRLFGIEAISLEPTLDLVLDLCHPDDRQAMADSIQRTIETGKDYDFEHRLIHPDGREVVLHERGALVADGSGEGNRFLGTTQDITVRVRIDKELEDARSTLEQRVEERTEELQITLETLVEGVITIDDQGIVEAFNSSAEALFGYPAAEIIGRNVKNLMPDDVGHKHEDYLNKYLETGQARMIGSGRELTGRRKDGSTFLIRLGVAEMEVGGLRKYVGTVHDITERKQAEIEMHAARERAEAASAAKSEFLSSMSHELRTPMNAVLGFAQLLKADPARDLSDDQNLFIDEILSSGERMMELVDDVLQLNDLDAGNAMAEGESEDTRLNVLVDPCLEVISVAAGRRDITVDNQLNGYAGARISVVPRYFTRALLNLLGNAVKYNCEGGRITVGCQAGQDGRLRISVADTGAGIVEQFRDKVFEPFERLGASASSTAGTGIGLTVARHLVESMGGKVDYDSTPGEGSTFWIEVPAAEFETT